MQAHTIYVVVGQTGEYSDRTEWFVCWRHTEEDANTVLEICRQQAKVWSDQFRQNKYSDEAREAQKQMFDPWFQMDYTGTEYHVWPLHDDPRLAGEPDFGLKWWAERRAK